MAARTHAAVNFRSLRQQHQNRNIEPGIPQSITESATTKTQRRRVHHDHLWMDFPQLSQCSLSRVCHDYIVPLSIKDRGQTLCNWFPALQEQDGLA
jgi:hypothetical protein